MEKRREELAKIVWALKNGELEVVKEMLLTAEDVNQVVDESADRVPLHIVADFGQKDVMAFLIEMGADVNVVDKHGFTPLICACYESHLACVELLLEKGADKEQKAKNGECAFEAAGTDKIKALLQ